MSPQGLCPQGEEKMPSETENPAGAGCGLPENICISVIGMAAAGKSKLGAELARMLGWAYADADHLIEAAYGEPLQRLTDILGKEEFLNTEEAVIRNIRLNHCVLSTGGSAVYREKAILHLKEMGPLLHIDVPLPIIIERISRKPDRGLAIAPGQTIEDLFNERRHLYEKYADFTVRGGNQPVQIYAKEALALLRNALNSSRSTA
jgi:shikimate kinase